MSVSTRRKTVIRGIRITEEMQKLLEQDAQGRGITVAALIGSILKKYAEFDRYAERLHFVSMQDETLRDILDAADPEKLQRIVREKGLDAIKAAVLFRFGKFSFDTFLLSFPFFWEHAGLQRSEVLTEGRERIVSFRHRLGQNWSNFLSSLLREIFKTGLGITPEFDSITEDTVVLRIRAG